MKYPGILHSLLAVWLAALTGCASKGSYVELHVRDAAAHTLLPSGRVHYEFQEWVRFGPDTAMGGQPVREGVAELYVRPARAVAVEMLDASGYPPIVVNLHAPRDLEHFEPTPWKKGSLKETEPNGGPPAPMLEFRFAPSQGR